MIDPDATEHLPVVTPSSHAVDTPGRSYTGSHSRSAGLDAAAKALIIFLIVIAFLMGIGMGQTVFAAKSNLITYCAGSTCVQEYHDHCSDWWQLQHP
jgi:hypothetical protein